MKNLKKVAVILALVFSLLVGGVTAALAADGDTATDKETMLADKKAEIERDTPLSEYDFPVLVGPLTWEEDTAEARDKTKFGFTEIVSKDADGNFTGVETEEGGNSYFTVRYSENNASHTYPYVSFAKTQNTSNDVVIEFDFTSFGNLPTFVPFQHTSTVETTSGVRRSPSFFNLYSDGITPQNGAKVSGEYVKPGEWSHFSLIYHRESCTMDIYVDYELVCEGINTRDSGARTDDYVMSMIRIGPNGLTSCEFSLDNLIVYEGSHIRTVDLFDTMSRHETFNYYVMVMSRESSSIADRKIAYDHATELIGNYWNGTDYTVGALTGEIKAQVQQSVDLYNSFNYEELYNSYIVNNLNKFVKMVDDLAAIGRGLDLISERNSAIAAIDNQLAAWGNDILKTEDSNYGQTLLLYQQCKDEIKIEQYINDFCKAVERFYNAIDFTTATMQRHYNTMMQYVNADLDTTLVGVEGFERFTENYAKYLAAGELLLEKTYNDNAKRIIDCVAFIREYDTVEEWVANYDYINNYIILLRKAIRAGDYNAEFDGVEEAIDFFNFVDEYFYADLQERHIAYITEILDRYAGTDGYVGRMGICALVTAYLEDEDVDFDNEKISALVDRLNVYQSELDMIKEDYIDVLEQNTLYFKSIVEKMYTVTDYAQLSALYSEARLLYIAMNVGDESLAELIEYYDEVNAMIKNAEAASANFILATTTLAAAVEEGDKDAIFAALVDCYTFAADSQLSIEGVSEAMEFYVAQLNAYDSAVNESNAQISDGIHAVGSVRANCGSTSVIAVVVKKLED